MRIFLIVCSGLLALPLAAGDDDHEPRPNAPAYLIPPGEDAAIRRLHAADIDLEIVREDLLVAVEVIRPGSTSGWLPPTPASRNLAAGTILVPMRAEDAESLQLWLEPGNPESFTFTQTPRTDHEHPVWRLPDPACVLTSSYSPPRHESRKEALTFEGLYGKTPLYLGGRPAGGFVWDPSGSWYWQRKNNLLWKVHAWDGKCQPSSYRPEPVREKLAGDLKLGEKQIDAVINRLWRGLNRTRTAAIVAHDNDLYHLRLDGSLLQKLTDDSAPEEVVDWSPDEQKLAFVRESDLYVADIERGEVRRLTASGSDVVRNGKATWVYYEELFHRNWQAFRWSPDSQCIAFLESDQRGIEPFTIANHLDEEPVAELERYPFAGSRNPRVRVGIVSIQGGDPRWIPLPNPENSDHLISHFNWTPDASALDVHLQDRSQTRLDYLRYDLATSQLERLFRESTEAWVVSPGTPIYLEQRDFVFTSERDGWRHLYHFDTVTCQVSQITGGDWEVRELHRCEAQQNWIYFSGTGRSTHGSTHTSTHLYRVRPDGSELQQITRAEGTHSVVVSPTGEWYIDSSSSFESAPAVSLRTIRGDVQRRLDINPVDTLQSYHFGELETLEIISRGGTPLTGYLLKPPSFDASLVYPLWIMTYGGPQSPSIRNTWQQGRRFEQMLATLGILVLRVDPRSASGQGARSAWPAYRRLGIQEVEDLEDAAAALAERPYVDSRRIGISGHSYGGFLAAFALTQSTRFTAAIAGAPVTDWRHYDTIYTERYMGTPKENSEGYDATSVVLAAKNLHGRLLLVHGARDDNVHLRNTLRLAHALQQAEKDFDLMIYPAHRHGLSGRHYQRLLVDFIARTMQVDFGEDRR